MKNIELSEEFISFLNEKKQPEIIEEFDDYEEEYDSEEQLEDYEEANANKNDSKKKRRKSFLDLFKIKDKETVEEDEEYDYDYDYDDEFIEEQNDELELIREVIKDKPVKEDGTKSVSKIENYIKEVRKPSFLDAIRNIKKEKDEEELKINKPTYEELEEENRKLKTAVDKLTSLYDKYLALFEEEIGSRDQRIKQLEEQVLNYQTDELIDSEDFIIGDKKTRRR